MPGKFGKKVIEATIGAAIIPVGTHAIDTADMGALGNAAKIGIHGGYVKKVSQKFL